MGKILVNIPRIKPFTVGEDLFRMEFHEMGECNDPTHTEDCKIGIWDYPSIFEIETVEMDEDEYRAQSGS